MKTSLRKLLTAVIALVCAIPAHAGTVNGNIQTASSGAVVNGTLTFTLNQFAVVSGTAQVVATGVNCYTSAAGAITGEPDPQTAPVLSVNLASGTLAAGTYFVKYTYFDGTGESLPSPEASVTLASPGTVIIAAPAIQPANATGWRVYISAATGTETRQSSQTGFAASYQQTAALSAGAALPGTNTSACSIRFTDEMIPSTTYYTINLVNSGGSKIAGYPISQARFYGGTNGSVNVSSGWPVSIGGVIWPSPIVSTPNSNATQSIAGGISLGAFPLTAGVSSLVTGQSKSWRDCRGDGLVANGFTDDSTTMQACWNNAVAAGQGTIVLPCGVIEIRTSQNYTNTPGMKISGCGSQRCRFTGSCGTNYTVLPNTTVIDCATGTVPCLDLTGSGSTTIADLTVNTCAAGTTCSSALSGASTIALLLGRDLAGGGTPSFVFAQWVTLRNVQIQMAHSASANSNFGSIGFYDYGGEQLSTVNSSIYADTPLWLTLTNATLGIASAYQTLSAPASMNNVHMSSTDLWYTSSTGAGLVAEGSVGTVQIDNSVGVHTSPIASALTSPAILFLGAGTNYNWRIGGQFENQTSSGSNGAIINTNHSLDHFNVDIDLAAYSGSGSPAGLIQWNGQTGLTLSNSVIRMRNINGTAVPLVQNTANTISGTLLDLSSTLNPASFSSLTLADDDIWAIGFADANLTLPAAGKYTLHDDTGVTVSSGKTTQLYARVRDNQGTALATTDFALGGNWGTSPSVAAVLGTDSLFNVTILSGGGAPAANPTITLTYKDGTWGTQPICIPSRNDLNAPIAASWSVDRASSSATAIAFTFVGTPATATNYNLAAKCDGK